MNLGIAGFVLLIKAVFIGSLVAVIFIAIKSADNIANRLRPRARFFRASTVLYLDFMVFTLFCMLAFVARALMELQQQ